MYVYGIIGRVHVPEGLVSFSTCYGGGHGTTLALKSIGCNQQIKLLKLIGPWGPTLQ